MRSIIGLTRVRNESFIMKETLDHMSDFCNKVIVYDDASTDNTVDICQRHPIVHKIIQGNTWDSNREKAEFENRQSIYLEALKICNTNDFIVYMDADERITEFDWNKLNDNIDVVVMRLFDFYITKEDIDMHYTTRKWIGPEYRDIRFVFRVGATLGYSIPDQRECSVKPGSTILCDGFVKHYGKAISVEEWENTCDYYGNHFPKYSKKWLLRKNKAIHDKSDFGRELITWEQKKDYGVKL